jgi:hypothetical protein
VIHRFQRGIIPQEAGNPSLSAKKNMLDKYFGAGGQRFYTIFHQM